MKSHRDYIDEQVKKNPKFAEDVAEAEREVAIAVALAKAREERGLSQAALAKLTGMKQPQIARMESGAYFPAFGTLVRVIDALDARLEISRHCCTVTPRQRVKRLPHARKPVFDRG